MTDKIIEPTPEEHAYHLGWQAYQNDLGINANPYDAEDETVLYEEYTRGWSNAQLGDE